MVKRLPTMRETRVRSLGREDPLEKEMATHSSILAMENPMDGLAWWVTVHGVVESWTRLSDSLRPHQSQHARPPRRSVMSGSVALVVSNSS